MMYFFPVLESCTSYGNVFTPVAGTNCAKYTQSAPRHPAVQLTCPGDLKFDVSTCVCNFADVTVCSV